MKWIPFMLWILIYFRRRSIKTPLFSYIDFVRIQSSFTMKDLKLGILKPQTNCNLVFLHEITMWKQVTHFKFSAGKIIYEDFNSQKFFPSYLNYCSTFSNKYYKVLSLNYVTRISWFFYPFPRPCHRWSHFWDPPT